MTNEQELIETRGDLERQLVDLGKQLQERETLLASLITATEDTLEHCFFRLKDPEKPNPTPHEFRTRLQELVHKYHGQGKTVKDQTPQGDPLR